MKILFLSTWYPSNIIRWLSTGFEQAGCEVKRCGKVIRNHYGIFWPEEDCPGILFEVSLNEPLNLKKVLDESAKNGFEPDILIVNDDWINIPLEETVGDIPLCLIQHEGWNAGLQRIEKFKPDVAYTGQPLGVFDEPRKEIYPGFKYLPGACSTIAHPFLQRERFMSDMKRDLDFVFFGALSYDNRQDICRYLNSRFIIKYGQVACEEYRKLHNRSLTTMECSGGQQYIKWRIFEAMSMGCVVISDRFDLLDTVFESGEHYLPCDWKLQADGRRYLDSKHLRQQIEFLKNNPDEYRRVQENAFRLVREKHTYLHRAKMILADLGFGEKVESFKFHN